MSIRLVAALFSGLTIGLALGHVTASADRPQQAGRAEVGRFQSVSIQKRAGMPSALDIRLDGKGKAVRFFAPTDKEPRTYFNDAGMLYTNGWVVISGTYRGTGEGYNIEPPSNAPSMLAVWSDVLGPAIQVRAANAGARSYIFQALDRRGNHTLSIEQDGALRWGAASRAAMDTNLYRSAAKTLKTDGSLAVAGKLGVGTAEPAATLHVRGSQSVQRTAVRHDYAVTDTDYYLAITDTDAARTVTLPSAAGREGRVYVIKDEGGGAASHPITVQAGPGQRIDGAPARTIRTNYGVLRVISNGSNWFGM